MELSALQLQQLKAVELTLLRAFLRVCEQLNLNYFFLEGSLLGAVRHSGFIPWDDDIDVGLFREDYEILMAQGQALLPDGLFLQNFATDPEYPHPFAKLRCDGTLFLEHSLKNCRIHHGIYIDIFPLDYYPETRQRWFQLKNLLLKLRISFAFSPDVLSPAVRFARWFTLPLFPSLKEAVRKRDALYRSSASGDRVASHGGAWREKEIVPAHWYGEGMELLFEGIPIRVPKESHLWLTQVYGDYMQLPPVEQRIPHHFVDAFTLECKVEYLSRTPDRLATKSKEHLK